MDPMTPTPPQNEPCCSGGNCSCGSGKGKIVLVIILAALLAGGGVYAWQKSVADKEKAAELKTQNEELQKQNEEMKKEAEESQKPIFNESRLKNLTSTDLIYINTDYGFTLTFPETWTGYTATNRTLNWGEAGSSPSLDFGLSAQKDLFNISMHTQDQWDKIEGEEGEKPVLLGKNDQYVFGWAQAQSTTNTQMEKRYAEIPEIIKTFKTK